MCQLTKDEFLDRTPGCVGDILYEHLQLLQHDAERNELDSPPVSTTTATMEEQPQDLSESQINNSSNQSQIEYENMQPLHQNSKQQQHVDSSLTNNNISSVSLNAFKFSSVLSFFSLYLDNNQITALPTGVFKYISAINGVSISLTKNQLRTIPLDVFCFPSAAFNVYIYLGSNKITLITSQFVIPKARFVRVHLNDNQITKVPSRIFNFTSVEELEIRLDNNSITTIAPGVFNFTFHPFRAPYKISLSLSNNKISAIPPNSFAQGKIYIFI